MIICPGHKKKHDFFPKISKTYPIIDFFSGSKLYALRVRLEWTTPTQEHDTIDLKIYPPLLRGKGYPERLPIPKRKDAKFNRDWITFTQVIVNHRKDNHIVIHRRKDRHTDRQTH